MNKLMKTWRPGTALRRACMAGLIWMRLSGCNGPRVVVVPADQTETFVVSNQVFRVPMDGVYMPLARYQRYRRAVADRIQELQEKR